MAKRIIILAGHYGSGKTNVAVNLAFWMKENGTRVAIADLDIVNPYFRTKDSAEDLKRADIRLISSEFANTNVDIPSLPQDMYAIVDDKNTSYILDIGGDDRGALALGRLTPAILEENSYEMLLVVNFYRPLTRDIDSLLEVMHEMEAASGIRFTGIVNNSNIGEETLPEDVVQTEPRLKEFSQRSGLPILFTTVKNEIYPDLKGTVEPLFPLKLQKKIF